MQFFCGDNWDLFRCIRKVIHYESIARGDHLNRNEIRREISDRLIALGIHYVNVFMIR